MLIYVLKMFFYVFKYMFLMFYGSFSCLLYIFFLCVFLCLLPFLGEIKFLINPHVTFYYLIFLCRLSTDFSLMQTFTTAVRTYLRHAGVSVKLCGN